MSKQSLYSVFDIKTRSYAPIFIADNHETAKRMVISAMSEESHLHKFAEDFRLMYLGDWDNNSGAVVQCDKGSVLVSELMHIKPKAVLSQTALEGRMKELEALIRAGKESTQALINEIQNR